MNIHSLLGKKITQTQGFLEDGRRVPVTSVMVNGNVISQIKKTDTDGYTALQIATGSGKNLNKPQQGHLSKAGITTKPRFFREIRVEDVEGAVVGSEIAVSSVFKAGDVIDVTGISKGKGFAGGVKRHHFKGGPRTHGQSDRERAPGSIGQTTTPGRVYKGKKMAGKMGFVTSTVKNLVVLDVVGDTVLVKGLIPGVKGSMVMIKKVGEDKKFVPMFKEAEEKVEEVVVEAEAPVEEKTEEAGGEKVKEEKSASAEATADKKEEK